MLSPEHLYYRQVGAEKVSVVHERGRGIAWRIWPGAHVLLDWLEEKGKDWLQEPCHCVEIGAGVGLVGVVCAGLGVSRVTLTDLPEELDALRRSVGSNLAAVQNRLSVMPLSFGCEEEIAAVVNSVPKNFKLVVLGSELIYWESLFLPIAQTLALMLAQPDSVAFIGYRIRVWKTEKRFFTKVLGQCGLQVEVVGQWRALETDGASQVSGGEVRYEEEGEWNTRVYKIFKRPQGDVEEKRNFQHDELVENGPQIAPKKKAPKLGKTERKGRVR